MSASDGITKVVVFGPKLEKRKVRPKKTTSSQLMWPGRWGRRLARRAKFTAMAMKPPSCRL